jgi:carbamoyl-phosphate synthase small subunit
MRGPFSPISDEVKSESLFREGRRDASTATRSLPIKLFLEDGSEFDGVAFGACRPVVGEVVVTTAMSGYVESLTDPSFRGHILVLAYPLAGNYGVPAARRAGSIDAPYESSQIQVQGLVVQHAISCPSHHASARTLGNWLASAQSDSELILNS